MEKTLVKNLVTAAMCEWPLGYGQTIHLWLFRYLYKMREASFCLCNSCFNLRYWNVVLQYGLLCGILTPLLINV